MNQPNLQVVIELLKGYAKDKPHPRTLASLESAIAILEKANKLEADQSAETILFGEKK